MLKKLLSILLATVILSSAVVGISLVNVNAITETKYYLFGDIHGAHYSLPDLVDKDDKINLDECNFTDNGLLTVSFAEESYVAIKDSNNNYYMTDGLQNSQSTSATLYKTSETDINDITKMLYVPAETNATFTLTENSDGTLTLSYNSYPYTKNDSRTKLSKLLELYCWDFDYTPEYWYNIYTKESYDAYLAAKQKAEKLLADENATDEELKAMINEFKTARSNLVSVGNTEQPDITISELENYVNDADIVAPGNLYSDESIKAFENAFAFAQEVLKKENPTQEELNTAYYNLNSAIKNLERVGWIAAPYVLGDYYQDQEVNVKDVTQIQLVLANLSENKLFYCMADVNKDFRIDIKDATMIQLYCVNFRDEASCGYTGTDSINYYFNTLYEL